MNKNYLSLWGLLAAAFLVFLLLAFCDEIGIGSFKLKTPSLHGIIADDTSGDFASLETPSADTVAPMPEPPRQIVLDQSPKTVLLIGDSMIEGLARRLSAYCDASSDTLYAVIWYSSNSELYGESHLISDYISLLKPDYVFVSLGGNELFVNDIAQKRDKYVKAIIDDIGEIPYLWIGPPNWREDTGINDLIRDNVRQGCFFLSNGMHFDRNSDGAHPTKKSSAEWVDSIVRWMPNNSYFYLPFVNPEAEASRPLKYFIHQPGPLTSRPK